MTTLRVSEIFLSIQGEGPSSGLKTIFVRFAGCNLFKYGGCRYCDTSYAQDPKSGDEVPLEGLVDKIERTMIGANCRRLCLTGGEVLCQSIEPLMEKLQVIGTSEISIETNGTKELRSFDVLGDNDFIVMDVKTPCSGMHKKYQDIVFKNLTELRDTDVVKFVCNDAEDVEYAEGVLRKYPTKAQLYISPVWKTPYLKEIAGRVMFSRYSFRLQTQLHKIIYGPIKRGV